MTPHPVALTPALVVEDDDGDRRRIHGLLEGLVASARVDWASDLASARVRLAGGGYALALVDVQLPDGSGIDLIGWIGTHAPHTAAVIVSSWAAEDTILAGIRAGAIGYLLKSGSDEELRIALRSLARGGAPVDPLIARRILEMVSAVPPARGDPRGAEAAAPPLSGRESEILHLVARGLSNREIAEVLDLSRLTIEGYTKGIYRKLAVGSRTAAVFEARSLGLLE